MRILVVEDDLDSNELLKQVLIGNGHQVDCAVNGKLALKELEANIPDLIISDILMPEMDGYELCQAVKEDPRYKHVPFIVYTATYTDSRDEQLAIKLGAVKFVIKPVSPGKLIEIINDVLELNLKRNSNPDEDEPEDTLIIDKMYQNTLRRKLDKKIDELDTEKRLLEDSEKRYSILINSLKHDYFFFTMDSGYNLLFLSPSIKNILGYTITDFGKSIFTKFVYAINSKENLLEDILSGNEPDPIEISFTHANHEKKYLEIKLFPIFGEKKNDTQIQGIVRDITTTKLTQHSQKMETIGQLTSGITHDFNNMLASIMGFAELANLAVKESGDEKLEYFLNNVLISSRRARDLVAQLLIFSRGGSEKIEALKLTPLINESMKMLTPTMPSSIDFDLQLGDDLTVLTNPVQMHQLIMNLCINARDAMQNEGCITIKLNRANNINVECCACRESISGDFIQLQIQDTGSGIQPDKLQRIFDPYFTTKNFDTIKGTGMGLAVVHGIMHKHGGHIVVDSIIDKGTTFSLLFPLSEDTDIAPEIDGMEIPILSEKNFEGTILIVDDEESIGEFMSELLRHFGYQTTVETDSLLALAKFKENPDAFDLVVTDLTMPGMNGYELTKSLHRIRPELPIILCSGHSAQVEQPNGMSQESCNYLQKPVNSNEFLKLINNLLNPTKP